MPSYKLKNWKKKKTKSQLRMKQIARNNQTIIAKSSNSNGDPVAKLSSSAMEQQLVADNLMFLKVKEVIWK